MGIASSKLVEIPSQKSKAINETSVLTSFRIETSTIAFGY